MVIHEGTAQEMTVRVVLESAEFGREYFDYDNFPETLAAVERLLGSAVYASVEDNVERCVSVAIVPKSCYGDSAGYGFDLGDEEADDDRRKEADRAVS